MDAAAVYLDDRGVHLVTRPAHRREGRAFFVMDPDGNLVEFYSMRDTGINNDSADIDISSPNVHVAPNRPKIAEESDSAEVKKSRRSRK